MKDIPADSLIKNYFPVDYIDSFSKVMVTGQALTATFVGRVIGDAVNEKQTSNKFNM